MCLHALLEGFPLSHHHNLAIGIAIHHFPIAIILTTFFLGAQLNKVVLFIFMLSFAIMTPFGTLISDTFPVLNQYYTEITAVVIGVLFHISSTIIFESSEGHKFNIAKIYYDERKFDLAVAEFQKFIQANPSHEKSKASIHLILDTYNQREDYKGLIQFGQSILTGRSPAAVDGEFRKDIAEIVKQAQFRTLEDKVGDPAVG